MDDEEQLQELKRLAASSEEKLDYWLMAIETAAIAFAVQQTRDAAIRFTMIPLALAVLLWGYAFYAGYRRQRFLWEYLASNYDLVQRHSMGKSWKDDLERTKALRKTANRWGGRQFPCIMLGGILYLAWHVIEMALRE